jgi:hypothetical protein
MEAGIRQAIDELGSKDDAVRVRALKVVLKATEETVTWPQEIWDDLAARLAHENSYQRSIAAMVLCNLAKSDSSNRMRGVLGRLLRLTEDEKFITSRQTIQNVWKVAATGTSHQKKVVDHLAGLFERCGRQKHGNLLRQDIIQSLRKLFDERGGVSVRETALRLIGTEADAKYRKKLAAYWKGI